MTSNSGDTILIYEALRPLGPGFPRRSVRWSCLSTAGVNGSLRRGRPSNGTRPFLRDPGKLLLSSSSRRSPRKPSRTLLGGTRFRSLSRRPHRVIRSPHHSPSRSAAGIDAARGFDRRRAPRRSRPSLAVTSPVRRILAPARECGTLLTEWNCRFSPSASSALVGALFLQARTQPDPRRLRPARCVGRTAPQRFLSLPGLSWTLLPSCAASVVAPPHPQAAAISTFNFKPASSTNSCRASRTNCCCDRPRIFAKRAARSGLTTFLPFSMPQRWEAEIPSLFANRA